MREENLKEALTSIESELYSVKEQLFEAKDLIRYAQRRLGALIQTIGNLSTQSDTHVCKCKRKKSEEVTSSCGEKQETDYQLTHDRVKIAEDFWKSCKSEE